MIYRNNIGLLLIAISVAFASMMSTLVKLMNSIDPPVPMLEVSLVLRVLGLDAVDPEAGDGNCTMGQNGSGERQDAVHSLPGKQT